MCKVKFKDPPAKNEANVSVTMVGFAADCNAEPATQTFCTLLVARSD